MMYVYQNNTHWMTLLNVNADTNTFALFLILKHNTVSGEFRIVRMVHWFSGLRKDRIRSKWITLYFLSKRISCRCCEPYIWVGPGNCMTVQWCNIIYWNGKIGLLWSWTLPKVPIISENVSNLRLNFLYRWTHSSLSTRTEAARRQTFAIF